MHISIHTVFPIACKRDHAGALLHTPMKNGIIEDLQKPIRLTVLKNHPIQRMMKGADAIQDGLAPSQFFGRLTIPEPRSCGRHFSVTCHTVLKNT